MPIFGLCFSCRRLALIKTEFFSEPLGKLNLLECVVRISVLNFQNPVSNMRSESFTGSKTETYYFVNNSTVVTEMLVLTIRQSFIQ